jgi:hypothetical protein
MHHVSRRQRARLLYAFSACCLLTALLTGPLSGARAPAARADDLPYTLEVSPTTGLVDGQAVSVVVRAATGQRIGSSGLIYICRADATYTSNADLQPYTAGKCPNAPISSSGSLLPWPIRSYPNGSTSVSTVRMGTGTTQWGPAGDPDQFSLTCDPANPCRLVIEIPVEGRGRFIDASTLLTFADDSPIGACGGSDPDALNAGGPDRMLGTWINWTRSQCVASGSQASTLAVLTGEGDGHESFARGQADLSYSAVGPHFPGSTPEEPRASVSVPVGLNAAVIGVLGGYGTRDADWPDGVPRPFTDVKVTIAEMASLFGAGPFLFEASNYDSMAARNPQLAAVGSLTNFGRINPLAPAGAEAVSWLATTAFDTQAADQWRTPPLDIEGNPPDVPRGVHASFALADPPFVSALFELYSAQSILKKAIAENEFKPYNYGPIWILTDLATASQLGIPTVAVQNAAGNYVAPTADSLRAAVPAMEEQADGTFLPDIATEAPDAYPLTFVEHAVAPTEPLLDAACEPRTGSQELLADWLAYITGPGQAVLPAGMVGLTPELAAAAEDARAAVGQAAPTGDCAPEEPTTTTTTTPPPGALPTPRGGTGLPPGAPPGGIEGFESPIGGSGGPGSSGSGGSSGGATIDSDTDDGDEADDAGGDELDGGATADVEMPEPGGQAPAGGLAGTGALLGLAALGGVGGMISSGRPLRLPGRSRP